ncbi:hypothetical protein SDC9_136681 [bioreactor metagenome]|uniref:Uncharacterized protein n=1 Tax=bioreactor metagenome TaxID=1076179 RepID=A0A645DJZ2_9ZZZZ
MQGGIDSGDEFGRHGIVRPGDSLHLMGGVRHLLHTAGHINVAHSGFNAHSGVGNGLAAGAALAVQIVGAALLRAAGQEAGQAGDVAAVAGHIAQDDVFYLARLDAGPGNCPLDRLGGKLGLGKPGPLSAVFSNSRSGCRYYNYIL